MQPQDGFPPPTGQQPLSEFQEPVRSNGKIITGFILAVISILFLPIVFGPIAITLGYLADRDNDSRGRSLLVAGVVCMILGFVLGAIFAPAR